MHMPVHRFSNSLATRLVIIALLVVVCGSLARYYFLAKWLRGDLEALVFAERRAIADYVAGAIDDKLIERRSLLERMAATLPPELLDQPEPLRVWLQERHALLPHFSLGLMVLDQHGAAIAEWPPASGRIGGRYGGDRALEETLEGKTTMAAPVMDEASKQPSLPMATPIRDRSGAVRGALVGIEAISALHLLDFPRQGRTGGYGGLLLISPKDHLFVSSTDPSMVLQALPARGVNLLHDRAMDGYRGTGITINAQGVEELSAMVSVPSANWFVVARVPTAEAFAAVARTKTFVLRSSLITAALVSLLVTALIWWALKPLFDAARQADAMTRGDAPLQPLRVARNDEVGHLTAAFNRLLTKLSNAQLELSQMAHHDSLTGLPNRRLLADRLGQSLARSRRNRTRIALLVMDLDGFKQINDTYGHEAGDEALRVTAERFTSALRRDDTLARLGGDEFVLLASDLAGEPEDVEEVAQAIASKCIAIASQPLTIGGAEIRLGVSVGIAIDDGECDPHRLLDTADQAMYEAKQAGRGRFVFSKRVDATFAESNPNMDQLAKRLDAVPPTRSS